MISVEEARAKILTTFKVLPPEDVSLDKALGRVLAKDVIARRTQPPLALSSMDGYALRSNDLDKTPKILKEIGKVAAGDSFEGVVRRDQTVRIFTGAPLPKGADTIIIQENTEATGDQIKVKTNAAPGQYVRKTGLDFTEGDLGLSSGKLLSVRDVSLAAAMNYPWLSVHRKPRIAVLATGDEIVRPGEPIKQNQIVSSNALALQAFVEVCGGIAINLGISPDQKQVLQEMTNGARGTDLLVTTGGISVGEHDLVREALNANGLEIDFWRVAMRPGKPVMFGKLGAVPILGLPGNPVSSIVCALVFLLPVMRRMLGLTDQHNANLQKAFLSSPLPENDNREDYLRATIEYREDGTVWTRPFKRQDSSMLTSLAKAQCLIIRAPHAPKADAGQTVEVMKFPSGLANS